MNDLITYGIVIHLICDWILQNDWMATNKANLRHPAGYIHAGIHALGMAFIFPPLVAFAIGITHLLIDTRKPVQWWQSFYRQTTDGPYAIHVAIWLDQVLHITVIALAALVSAS